MSTINSSFGLNLSLLSFELPKNLVKDSDDIRVSITTLPDENKQAFTISARKIKDPHLTFGVNVTIPQETIPDGFVSDATEKIIIVFRKKSFFYNDPIIAASLIQAKDFPKNLSVPATIKTFDIYEPSRHNEKDKKNSIYDGNRSKKNNRAIIGRMQVQMSLTDPFHLQELDNDEMFDLDGHSVAHHSQFKNGNDTLGDNFFGFRKLNNF